jgi:hypothetical protein
MHERKHKKNKKKFKTKQLNWSTVFRAITNLSIVIDRAEPEYHIVYNMG